MQVASVLALVAVDSLCVCGAGDSLPFWFLRGEYHGGQEPPACRPGPRSAGCCVQEMGALAKEPPSGHPVGWGPSAACYSDLSVDVPCPDFYVDST